MAQLKKYDSPAQKQAAYLQRLASARVGQLQAKGLPPLPAISSFPGETRWKALIQNSNWSLQTTRDEMQSYFDSRSPKWQESDKGENFQARLDELTDILEASNQWLQDD